MAEDINEVLMGRWRERFLDSQRNAVESPNFNDALKFLCDAMGLVSGTIVEEGHTTTCPVHYAATGENGSYTTQIVGTVLGTSMEVVCSLLVVHTLPILKSKTFTCVGRWCQNRGNWLFDEE